MATMYEIVMLPNGEVVLRSSDESSEPLVRIVFSDEARYLLQQASLQVARAMIDAGIEAFEQLEADDLEAIDVRYPADHQHHTLH